MLKKHKQLKDELEMATEWHNKRKNLIDVKLKIVWAQVAENEKVIAKIETEIAKCEETLEKADSKKIYYAKEKTMVIIIQILFIYLILFFCLNSLIAFFVTNILVGY